MSPAPLDASTDDPETVQRAFFGQFSAEQLIALARRIGVPPFIAFITMGWAITTVSAIMRVQRFNTCQRWSPHTSAFSHRLS